MIQNPNRSFIFLCCSLLLLIGGLSELRADDRPNVVIVLTDDQGYGDVAAHGNPIIKTPNIDKLFGEATSFSDYHVAPTCSPTRSALLTGHWTNRTGVWHTINGRSMLRANEVTIGQLFADGGYQTGMFGKWHLGDNYPYRAEDRGFMEVFRHGGGGVGQTPDVWDNAYFDGSYFHNGKIEPAKGFCTDFFFSQANQFIRKNAASGKPFLAYIATNAPHGPLHCPTRYLELYADQNPGIAAFYGMITNIDDNVGRTRKLLEELGIADNTIFIFTTDNGTASGARVFNAGMRGKKGSEYDGGHRVPLMIHYPARQLNQRREIKTLAHAVDVVPTLLDLCGIQPPKNLKFDGRSLKPLLDPDSKVEWEDRFLVTDSQRVRDPIKWRKSAVMSQRWRLINGTELYDIQQDPGQTKDLAGQYPEQVRKMRQFYEDWWAELEPTFAQTTEIYVGHQKAPRVSLTAHDWISNSGVPWNQSHIRRALGYSNPAQPKNRSRKSQSKGAGTNRKQVHDGHWAIKVMKTGTYRISVLRWPQESGQPITASLPPGKNVPGATRAYRATEGIAIKTGQAELRIDEKKIAAKPVEEGNKAVQFEVKLEKGSHRLSPVFLTGNGEVGAYYAIVETVN